MWLLRASWTPFSSLKRFEFLPTSVLHEFTFCLSVKVDQRWSVWPPQLFMNQRVEKMPMALCKLFLTPILQFMCGLPFSESCHCGEGTHDDKGQQLPWEFPQRCLTDAACWWGSNVLHHQHEEQGVKENFGRVGGWGNFRF